jgi:hypothetical protein
MDEHYDHSSGMEWEIVTQHAARDPNGIPPPQLTALLKG